jgi:hypothetical protein
VRDPAVGAALDEHRVDHGAAERAELRRQFLDGIAIYVRFQVL